MKIRTVAVATLAFALASALPAYPQQDLVKRVFASVALLYRQTESGGLDMTCTATAFEKTEKGYLFVTASHCVGESDTVHERVQVQKTRFYLTFDEKEDKKFYPAKLMMAGYQPMGDDFSIFSVETPDAITITPLGDEQKDEAGFEVINIASPNGLGKQVFRGFISSLYVDRPVVEDDINWQGVMLLQIESGPGSSGSSIVSVKQQAIIGFLVGHYGENTFVMPVSRFNAWRKSVDEGTYKYFKRGAIVDAPAAKRAPAAKK